jgi:nonsense-mediated mRNA decay protein 3
VKKAYPNRRKKSKARNWKLRSMAKEAGEEGETSSARGAIGRMGGRDSKKVEEDYELFLRDLEEDPEMRAAVNLYKAADAKMGEEEKDGRKTKKKVQYAMDVDETTGPSHDETDDERGEAENDFPEVRLEELLEEFDEMTLNAGDDETVEQP